MQEELRELAGAGRRDPLHGERPGGHVYARRLRAALQGSVDGEAVFMTRYAKNSGRREKTCRRQCILEAVRAEYTFLVLRLIL